MFTTAAVIEHCPECAALAAPDWIEDNRQKSCASRCDLLPVSIHAARSIVLPGCWAIVASYTHFSSTPLGRPSINRYPVSVVSSPRPVVLHTWNQRLGHHPMFMQSFLAMVHRSMPELETSAHDSARHDKPSRPLWWITRVWGIDFAMPTSLVSSD